MQHNVTELTQRLLRALDTHYNVIDMPAVVEIFSLLEKATITKELLETTRLGKHVNELRRKTDNDSLSKRAKELVRKWRNMLLPESNGQLKAAPPPLLHQQQQPHIDEERTKKRPLSATAANEGGTPPPPPQQHAKRPKINGQSVGGELDLSDNSNSSFKDFKMAGHVHVAPSIVNKSSSVILLNSDSNSSLTESTAVKQEGGAAIGEPKKRGRKKGSKNHKNLIDEAETSFSNKLAVSRGNSKVKTTQELIAGLQNKSLGSSCSQTTGGATSSTSKSSKEDLTLRAAKLTERVSMIDQKLNTTGRFKNAQKRNRFSLMNNDRFVDSKVIESGSVINDKSLLTGGGHDDDIIVVDDLTDVKNEVDDDDDGDDDEVKDETETVAPPMKCLSLSVEEARALLPPLDPAIFDCLNEEEDDLRCNCLLKCVDSSDEGTNKCYEWIDDRDCPARLRLDAKYRSGGGATVEDLHTKCLEGVNGYYGVGAERPGPVIDDVTGLYANVVPNVNTEAFPKENYKKYSISERMVKEEEEEVDKTEGCDGDEDNDGVVVEERTGDVSTDTKQMVASGSDSCGGGHIGNSDVPEERIFREWHEVLDTPSYNGEIFRILPYVIID